MTHSLVEMFIERGAVRTCIAHPLVPLDVTGSKSGRLAHRAVFPDGAPALCVDGTEVIDLNKLKESAASEAEKESA